MAVLSDNDRAAIASDYMQIIGVERVVLHSAILKTVIRNTVNAVDDWADSAATSIPATSYNNCLPTAFKNNATAKEKARVLELVINKRYKVTP